MSTTTDFITELVRVANQVEKIGEFEKRELLARAIVVIREMRDAAVIPGARQALDTSTQLQILVAELGAQAKTSDEVRQCLLQAASMIRDLHIVLDTGTETRNGAGNP